MNTTQSVAVGYLHGTNIQKKCLVETESVLAGIRTHRQQNGRVRNELTTQTKSRNSGPPKELQHFGSKDLFVQEASVHSAATCVTWVLWP